MFQLFDEEDEYRFDWGSIGNVEEGRINLGGEMPVLVYRLFQYTIKDELARQFGFEKTIEIFRNAGELAGKEFAERLLDLTLPFESFISHVQEVLKDNKIGILRLEEYDGNTGEAMWSVGEDIDCSGLPVTGQTVCHYDEGFFAGILKAYTKRAYIVREIDCWATGSRVCRFKANVENKEEK